jgi:hypothetical protein
MLHVVLEWQRRHKPVLEKAFFFTSWSFYLFRFLCPKKRWKMALLRDDNFFPWNRSYGVLKKSRIWFQNANLALWQMPPPPKKKVKVIKRKKWDFTKLENRFFNFNFFRRHFVIKRSLHFLNQQKILDFLIPFMTYFKAKTFHHLKGMFLTFFDTKTEKR